MIRPLLLFALALLVLLGGAPQSAPVGAQVGDPQVLCEMLPAGAERVEPGIQAGAETCVGYYGRDPETGVSLYSASISRHDSPSTAVANMQAFVGPNTSDISIGEGGYQLSLGFDDFGVIFTRGPFLVDVSGLLYAADSEQRVIAMAREIDQELAAALASAPPEDVAPAEQPPDAADAAEEPPDNSADIAGVFFGTELAASLLPRVRDIIGCPDTRLVDDPRRPFGEQVERDVPIAECPGGADGVEFLESFEETVPGASINESEMAGRVSGAITLAGFQGPDGAPLFPSIVAALPLIKGLGNSFSTGGGTADEAVRTRAEIERVRLVQRFIEMLAARDAAGWAGRFP